MTDLRIVQHKPLATALALKFRNKYRGMELEDLEAIALEALWRSTLKWSPEHGVTFGQYARLAIRRAFFAETDKSRRIKRQGRCVSMSVVNDDGEEGFMDLPSGQPSAETLLDRKRRTLAARRALGSLHGGDKEIISARLDGASLDSIGKQLGVTRERVRQREAVVLNSLRKTYEKLLSRP